MPGKKQLQQFSKDVLKIGDEVKVRASRGEKPAIFAIPEDIYEDDDSQDFVFGMPEKDDKNPADKSENISEKKSSDFADDFDLNVPDDSKNGGEAVASVIPDLDSILNGGAASNKPDTDAGFSLPDADFDLDNLDLDGFDLNASDSFGGTGDSVDSTGDGLGNAGDAFGGTGDDFGKSDPIDLNMDLPPELVEVPDTLDLGEETIPSSAGAGKNSGDLFGGTGDGLGNTGDPFGGLGDGLGNAGDPLGGTGDDLGNAGDSFGGLGDGLGNAGNPLGGTGDGLGNAGDAFGGTGDDFGKSDPIDLNMDLPPELVEVPDTLDLGEETIPSSAGAGKNSGDLFGGLGDDFGNAGDAFGGLSDGLGNAGDPFGGLGDGLGNAGDAFGGTSDGLGNTGDPLGGLGDGLGNAGDSFGGTGDGLGNTGDAFGGLGDGLGNADGAFGGLGDGLGNAGDPLGGTGDDFGNTGDAFGGTGDDLGNAGDAFGGLGDGLGNAGDAFGGLGDGFGNSGDPFDSTGDGLGNAGDAFGGLGDGLGNAGDSFGGLGDGLGNAGGPLGGTGDGLGNAGDAFGGTSDGLGNAGNPLGGTGDGLGNAGDSFGGTGDDFGKSDPIDLNMDLPPELVEVPDTLDLGEETIPSSAGAGKNSGDLFGGTGDGLGNTGDPFGGLGDGLGNAGDPRGGLGDGFGNAGDPLGGLGDDLGNAGDSFGGTGDGLGNTGDAFGGLGDDFGKSDPIDLNMDLPPELVEVPDTLDLGEEPIPSSAGAGKNSGDLFGGTGDGLGNTGDPLGGTGAGLGNAGDAFGGLGDGLGNAGDPLGGTGDDFGNTGDPLGGTGDGLGNTGDPFGGLGNGLGNSGDPLGGTSDGLGNAGDPLGGTGDGGNSDEKIDTFNDIDVSAFENIDFPSENAGESGPADFSNIDIKDTDESFSHSDDDFDFGSDDEFYIPGFSDTLEADLDNAVQKTVNPVELGKGQASPAAEKTSITEDEYKKFKKNLSHYPLNVKIAIEEMIANNEFTNDTVFEVIEKVIKKVSARNLASHLEKILDISLPVPRDFEHRTVEEYEAYKASFEYQLKNKIIPVVLLSIGLGFISLFLFLCAKHYIYKPLKANSLYKQGYALLEADEYPQSEQKFKEAVRYRNIKSWFYKFAQGYRTHKQYERAAIMYDDILKRYKNDRQAGLEYARMQWQDLSDYEGAIRILNDRLLLYFVNDADGLLELGDIYLDWGDNGNTEMYENARSNYASLMSLYGAKDLYLSRMLRYFIRIDDLKEVLRLKEIFYPKKKTLGSVELTELSGYMFEKMTGKLSPSEAYLKDRIEDVKALMERAILADPKNPTALYNMARYYINMANFNGGMTYLDAALDAFKNASALKKADVYRQIDSYRLKGEIFVKKQEIIKAVETFTEGISMFKAQVPALPGTHTIGKLYSDMADIDYFKFNNIDSAFEYYKAAIENENDTPSIRYKIGAIQYEKGAMQEAMGSFMATAEAVPDDNNLLMALGNVLINRNSYNAAKGYFEKLIDNLNVIRSNKKIMLPQVDTRDEAVVDMYMKASNNLGVILYNLAKRTGNSQLKAQATINFTESMRAGDALTRNQDSMKRKDVSNLAEENIRYMIKPGADFEPAAYPDIPRTLSGEEKGLQVF